MNETWYWKLGFSNNPFTIKPGAITNEIIAYNVQPIIERIKKGEPQFIEAPFGRGKTTILKGIIAKFGGKKKLVYANCIRQECLDVKNLLKNATIKGMLPAEVEASLNGNVIHLPYLTPEQAVELVRQRIGNLKLLPDYVIRELYARSDGNPRKLLQNCEDLCRKAVELSIGELTVTDVATLLRKQPAKIKMTRKPRAAETRAKEPKTTAKRTTTHKKTA